MAKADEIYKSKYLDWIRQHLLILIFVLAFFLRAAPNIYLEWRQPGWHDNNINEMEFYYDDVARSLISGKGFVHSVNPRSEDSPYKFQPGTPFHFVPPLYAWWLGVVYFLFGPNVLIAKILQCLMDASVCLLLYKIGRIITDNRVSLTAAFLYAIYPLAIYTSTRLYYQIPMNLALCWLILSFATPVTAKNGMWAGLALALSALAKPVTLPLIALLPVVRIFEAFYKKDHIKKDVIIWTIAFFMAVGLTLSPWTIRNYLVFHKLIPIQGGSGAPLIQGSKEEYIDLDVDTLRKKYGQSFGLRNDQFVEVALNNHLNHLKNAPLDYIRFLVKKSLLTWYNTEGKNKNFLTLLMQFPFLVFALFGFVASFKFWLKKPNWYIPALILYITGIQVVFFPLARYTLAVMPLVMLFTAFGLNKLLISLRIFKN